MKISKRKVDQHGNDIDIVKEVDILATKTDNLVCSIHEKKFKDHSDDELSEDYNLAGLRYQKSQGHLYHTDQIKPNEITSLADMTKLGISNYDLQAGVASDCRQDFNSFLDYNGHLSTLLMKLLDEVMSKPIPDKFKFIAVLIGTKNARLLSNCVNLTCDGYYESAMALIRSAMENYLLLEYLRDNQDKVEGFYNMTIEFKLKELFKNGRRKNKEFGKMWGELSNYYVHSNMLSLHTITKPSENSEGSYVHLLPYYDKESAHSNLLYAGLFKLLTLTPLSTIFVDEIENGQELSRNMIAFSKALIELSKNPNLQVDLVQGDRRNF